MPNLMGFKKVSKLPAPQGRSMYDPLLEQVRKDGGMYALDTQDRKRALSLSSQLRNLARKRKYTDLKVGMCDTTVYVQKLQQ